jgi:hypothetical protein
MPRDALGVVTLPVGNPVVSGTAISADVQNATVADLASMIEDSLSRSGKGGMNAAMKFADGTAAAPAVTFTTETNTGIFRSAGLLGLAVVGVVRAAFTSVLARFYTPVQMDSTLTVAGAATVTGTLGVTGVATFTVAPVLTAGITGIVKANLPAVGDQAGGAGAFGGNSVVINDLSAEITLPAVTGRPVVVSVQPGDNVSVNSIYMRADGGGDRTGYVYLSRSINGGAFATIACYGAYAQSGTLTAYTSRPVVIAPFIDNPGAGSIKYKLRYMVSAAGADLINEGMVVAAYEL